MVGCWRAHDDAKNSRFLVGVRRGASTIHTPPKHVQAQGVSGGVLGGGGVLLARVTALCLLEDTTRQTMGNCTIVSAIYCILRGLA